MKVYLGFAAYYATRLCADRERADTIASLLVDPRWPWPPWWAQFWLLEKFLKSSRSRKVVGAKGKAFLAEGIRSSEYRRLSLYRSSDEADAYSAANFETGQRSFGGERENPFEAWAVTDGDDLPEGKTIRAWVELTHELITALDAGSATISAFKSRMSTLNDVTLNPRVAISGVDFETPDFPRQNSRANFWRDKLGGTYVRSPRWGNYLGREHIAKIGGIDRIRSAVDPAQIVDFGNLVFIGLTDDPHDALTAEYERKRSALEALMAPVVAPAAPNEQPIEFPT